MNNQQMNGNYGQMGGSTYQENIPQINFECSDGQAMQLVQITTDKRFVVVQETVDYLRDFEENVAVCSIVGKYRTGKSFLMNKLLDLKKEGFTVSASVNACTKGLWIWSKPVYNEKSNLNIFFMDSEGLDSVDRDGDMDSKLFALSVLLSSYFIYNSIGAIDENSINSLALITNLIRTVTIDDETRVENTYQLSQYAPKFLWILRDFVLEIKDIRGQNVSPQVYLESVLTDLPVGQNGYTRNTDNSTKIRQSILNFFKHRDCMTLVRPVNDEEELRNIQNLRDNQIKPQFLDELYIIRDKVFKNCQQKVINGVGLNMSMLIAYLDQFVSSFNQNKLPAIRTAWETLLENNCENHYKQAIALYENDIKAFLSERDESLGRLELYRYLNQLRDLVMNDYMKCSYVEERYEEVYRNYRNRLIDYIASREQKIIEQNNSYAHSLNSDILNNLYMEYLKNEDLEHSSPESLIQALDDQVFSKYDFGNKGGEHVKTFVQSNNSQSINFFNTYFNAINSTQMKKKNSIVRLNEVEWEKFKQEQMKYETDRTKLNALNREIEFLDEQIATLRNNKDNTTYEKLLEKNEGLNNRLRMKMTESEKNAQELARINKEIEMLEKKKKGCC